MDPVAALAQQGAMNVGSMPQSIDPVQALAMGHGMAAPVQHQALANDNSLNSFVRSAANAATFNLGDVIAAAGDATIPLDKGASSAPGWLQRYKENIANQRGESSADQSAHPYVSLAGSIGGGIANPANRFLSAPQSLGGAILQGAGMGGAYGAGGAVGNSKDLADAAKQTAMGMGLGGVAGLAAHGLGKMLTGAARSPQAQLLTDEDVPLTIGQSLGGTTRTLEDASTHIPMMGNAIKGRQSDAIEGFNRAAYNRVLKPLGISYDKAAPSGNEAIDKIGSVISDAYGKAYDGASVTKSPALLANLDSAADDASNLLSKDKVAQIQANVHRLINSKFDDSGNLNSNDLKTAKNFFAEQSRAGPAASLEDRAVASAYGNVVDALKAGIAETDPERGAMLEAADKSYMRYVRIQNAAGSNNASGRSGIFTAAQLGQALRSADNSVRRGDFAKGLAPMQDLAQAGQAVLPASVPDSGTATRGLVDAAPWLLAAAAHNPMDAVAGAGALTGGTALYSRPGQTLGKALLFGAPGVRKAMGQIPPAMLPGFVAALTALNAGGKP